MTLILTKYTPYYYYTKKRALISFSFTLDDPKQKCHGISKSLFIKSQPSASSALSPWEGSSGTCVFPFYYKGEKYDHCWNPGNYGGVGWCSFTTNYVGKFGWCTDDCPMGKNDYV